MKIVLDVSGALAVATNHPATMWIEPALRAASHIIAPSLFFSEACNAAWKYFHIEGATEEDINLIAKTAISQIDTIFPDELLWPSALRLAYELDHPVYDCFYLALAQTQQAHLLTLDKRLGLLAQRIDLPLVREIGN